MQRNRNKTKQRLILRNRRANFKYTFLDKYIAGLVLTGTEIKSIRASQVSLQEAYAYFWQGELWIRGMHIAPYTQGNIYNHAETRVRKLLLHGQELNKLMRSQEKGLTIIPTQLFISERGLAKLEIVLAKGKKLYDKRHSIKERDLERAMRRNHL